MPKTSNKSKEFQQSYFQDYERIMKKSLFTTVIDVQWAEKGDFFEKFSMYGNYTPVKTSGSTTLINEI